MLTAASTTTASKASGLWRRGPPPPPTMTMTTTSTATMIHERRRRPPPRPTLSLKRPLFAVTHPKPRKNFNPQAHLAHDAPLIFEAASRKKQRRLKQRQRPQLRPRRLPPISQTPSIDQEDLQFVRLPETDQWWPCWHASTLGRAIQQHNDLQYYCSSKDQPALYQALEVRLKALTQALYQSLATPSTDAAAGSPDIWMVLGKSPVASHTKKEWLLSSSDIAEYVSMKEESWLTTMMELNTQSNNNNNPSLAQAMKEFQALLPLIRQVSEGAQSQAVQGDGTSSTGPTLRFETAPVPVAPLPPLAPAAATTTRLAPRPTSRISRPQQPWKSPTLHVDDKTPKTTTTTNNSNTNNSPSFDANVWQGMTQANRSGSKLSPVSRLNINNHNDNDHANQEPVTQRHTTTQEETMTPSANNNFNDDDEPLVADPTSKSLQANEPGAASQVDGGNEEEAPENNAIDPAVDSPTTNDNNDHNVPDNHDAMEKVAPPQTTESPKGEGPNPTAAQEEQPVHATTTDSLPATEDPTPEPMSEDTPPINDDVDDDMESPLVFEPEELPEVELEGHTVREKLQSALRQLRKEHERVVGCRKILSGQHQVSSFLHQVVTSGGLHGKRVDTAPLLHICGAPGSGKSMTVEQCCRKIQEELEQSLEDWEAPPKFCTINCSHLKNPGEAELKQLLKEQGSSTKHILRPVNGDASERPTVIFVLDEIDALISQNNHNHTQRTKSEDFVHTLIQWATDERYMVGLIGISNSVENTRAARLQHLGFNKGEKLVFQTYDMQDLTYIAMRKVGNSVVDGKVFELLSKKVAANSGDARRFLDLLARSIAEKLEVAPAEKLDAPYEPGKPLVKAIDVIKIVKKHTVRYKDLIEGLPGYAKMVLCSCMYLSKLLGSRPCTIAILKKTCLDSCGKAFDDSLGDAQMRELLGRLVDAGLLRLKHFDQTLPQQKLRFEPQLEDVETGIDETLMKDNFYQRMKEQLESVKLHHLDLLSVS